MTSNNFQQSISPGNEQREYWGSKSADQPGGRNLVGIKNPVVDALIDKVIFAPTRADVVTATHALDRVLLWNYYTVLNYYSGGTPVAYWNKFAQPKVQAKYGVDLLSWWVDPDKVKALKAAGYGGN
jgi:microcin C transport system substrate-binding protein